MQLLSVLGTGRYEETCYTWQGQQVKTPYVIHALCEFFQPDQVTVLVTQEAKTAHWQNLQQAVGQRSLIPVPIPSVQSEAEVWQIFDAVVTAVEPEMQVIFDITHAFRSIPLLVLLAAAFLQKARQVNIQGVYYGAFEANRQAPPIVDLTPAIKLLDWLTATDKFLATGSSVELGQLLSTIQQDFYRQGQPNNTEIRPTRLKSMGDRIQAISRSLELVRPLDLLDEAARLQTLSSEQLQNEVGIFAKPFQLLLEPIQQDYGQFALKQARQAEPTTVLQKQFCLLRWYVAKEQGTQAILLAREWLVSALCMADQRNYLDKAERKTIEDKLGQMIGATPSSQDIARYVQDPQKLAAVWSTLTEYRNDIAHTQMRPTQISADTLQTYVQQTLLSELSALFPQLTAEDGVSPPAADPEVSAVENTLEQEMLETLNHLPPAQQQTVLDFAQFLRQKYDPQQSQRSL